MSFLTDFSSYDRWLSDGVIGILEDINALVGESEFLHRKTLGFKNEAECCERDMKMVDSRIQARSRDFVQNMKIEDFKRFLAMCYATNSKPALKTRMFSNEVPMPFCGLDVGISSVRLFHFQLNVPAAKEVAFSSSLSVSGILYVTTGRGRFTVLSTPMKIMKWVAYAASGFSSEADFSKLLDGLTEVTDTELLQDLRRRIYFHGLVKDAPGINGTQELSRMGLIDINHNGTHEECLENFAISIFSKLKPESLTKSSAAGS